MKYVYLIKSQKTGEIYIGVTSDLRSRLRNHNAGLSKATKRGAPWTLVYYEAYLSSTDACRRERHLKHYGASLAHLKGRLKVSLNEV